MQRRIVPTTSQLRSRQSLAVHIEAGPGHQVAAHRDVMGVTLSKLWAAIKGALTGGAPAGTHSQQQQHRDTITNAKDVESASHSPTTTTEATMPEVKKWEITEVRFELAAYVGWDGGGNIQTPR